MSSAALADSDSCGSLEQELEAELAAIKDEIKRRMDRYQILKPLATPTTANSGASNSFGSPSALSLSGSKGNFGNTISAFAAANAAASSSSSQASSSAAAAAASKASSLAFQLMHKVSALDVTAVRNILSRAKREKIQLFSNAFDDNNSNNSGFGFHPGALPGSERSNSNPLPGTATPTSSVPRFDQRDLDGQTPLHIAALKGSVELTTLLLEYGLHPGQMDDDDLTPLDIAREKGHQQVVEILEKACAVRNTSNSNGSTGNVSKNSSSDTLDNQGGSVGSTSATAPTAASAFSVSHTGKRQGLQLGVTCGSHHQHQVSGVMSDSAGSPPQTPGIPLYMRTALTAGGGAKPSSPGSATSTQAAGAFDVPASACAEYVIGEDRIKGVIILVGLPARGKTYFARRVQRFFMFKGAEVQSFSAGDVRRRLFSDTSRSNMADHQAERVCDELALQASRYLVRHKHAEHCAAIIDGLNYDRALRMRLFNGLSSHGVPATSIVFLEVVVTDEAVVQRHIETAVADFMMGDRNIHASHFGCSGGTSKSKDNPTSGGETATAEQFKQLARWPTMYDVAQNRSTTAHPAASSLVSSSAASPTTSNAVFSASEVVSQAPTSPGAATASPTKSDRDGGVNFGSPDCGGSQTTTPSLVALEAGAENDNNNNKNDDDDDDLERAVTAEEFARKYRNLIRQMEKRYETMSVEHEGGLCFARSVNRTQLKCHNLAYAPLGRTMVKLLLDLKSYSKRFFLATIGETQADAEGRYGLASSTLLTPRGVSYSEALANYLAEQIPSHQMASETAIITCSAPAARQTVAPMLATFTKLREEIQKVNNSSSNTVTHSNDANEHDTTAAAAPAAAGATTTTSANSSPGRSDGDAGTKINEMLIRYLHTLDDLSYGDCDGMTRTEAEQSFPRHMLNMAENPYGCEFPRGESFSQLMQLRLEQHLSELEAVNVGNIVLVVPLTVAKALMLYFDPARYPVIRPEHAVRVEVPRGHVVCLTGSDRQVPQWVKLD